MINTTPTIGELIRTSASQVNSYHLCPRRWWLETVCENRGEETPELALGTWSHGHTENKLLGKTPQRTPLKGFPDVDTSVTWKSLEGYWADPRFPDPRPGTHAVEEPRKYNLGLTLEGVQVRGRIDFRDWSSSDHHFVLDHKTTGSIKYAKTSEELERDPQIITYSKFCLEQGAKTVTAAHGLIQTKNTPAHDFVYTEPMSKEHIDSIYYGPLAKTVREMKDVARIRLVEDTPCKKGKKTCKAFNRLCPFAAVCGVTEDAFGNLNHGDEDEADQPPTQGVIMSLREKMAGTPAATPPPAAPTGARHTGINPSDGKRPELAAPKTTTNTAQAVGPKPQEHSTLCEGSIGQPCDIPAVCAPSELTLYVDCLPVKGGPGYIRLEEEVARRAAPIEKKHNVTDVREVGYGEGTAELMAAFKKDPPRGVVVATTSGLCGYVVEVLLPMASVVVRGVR